MTTDILDQSLQSAILAVTLPPFSYPLPKSIEGPSPLDLYSMGFHVFPIDHACELDERTLAALHSTRISENKLSWFKDRTQNFGIMSGKLSCDIFFIWCQRLDTLRSLSNELGFSSLWISSAPIGYYLWIKSGFGTVKSKKVSNRIRVIGNQEMIPLPGSVHRNGEIVCWEQCEGNEPPTINEKDEFFLTISYVQTVEHEVTDISPQRKEFSHQDDMISYYQSLERSINSYPWGSGLAGVQKKKLYQAFLKCAKNSDKHKFNAPVRRLSEYSTLSLKTVTKYTKILIQDGLISLANCRSTGNQYSLTDEVKKYDTIIPSTCSVELFYELPPHDVWTYFGLNKTGWNIAEYLLRRSEEGNGCNLDEIVSQTKHSKKTVQKRLMDLENLELVWRENDLWFTNPDRFSDLDKCAEKLNVGGTTNRKAHNYQQQRQLFAEQLLVKRICEPTSQIESG